MHFCITGQYTAQALSAMMDNPTTNRFEAARAAAEAVGGKLISMYATQSDGPVAIFDVPEPNSAAAMVGVLVASGALENAKLTRCLTQDEVIDVRKKAIALRGVYKAPGK